jgi:enolase-phosphatase E1
MSNNQAHITYAGISHVLLDIEGTTCPVSFVGSILFPYASEHMKSYLERHQHAPAIRELLEELTSHWRTHGLPNLEHAPMGRGREESNTQSIEEQVLPDLLNQLVPYLHQLIKSDIKLTPLKDLQGKIWKEGYETGELVSPLFADVPNALKEWRREGLILAVYSSGSVAAQKLLYQYSNAGDLSPCFEYWFDTHQGSKQAMASYITICDMMHTIPNQVLFISDSQAELEAAQAAGLQVVCSDRPGNAPSGITQLRSIQDFSSIQFSSAIA